MTIPIWHILPIFQDHKKREKHRFVPTIKNTWYFSQARKEYDSSYANNVMTVFILKRAPGSYEIQYHQN